MAVATEAAAGGNGEGIPLPAGVAATAANGSQQGYPAEGVLVVGSMAPRSEGVLVIDLTAVAEEEEQKKDHSTAYARRESQIDLTAQTEEEGEDEKEAQGVDGPRAEGVPVMIDLTEESSDEEEEEEEEVRWVGQYSSTQSILLVGDGDFSFSLALATGFGLGRQPRRHFSRLLRFAFIRLISHQLYHS
jgi:25S rRNA (uracil2634-N3)-methyltransferase